MLPARHSDRLGRGGRWSGRLPWSPYERTVDSTVAVRPSRPDHPPPISSGAKWCHLDAA
jgi:hypothetical protein